MAFSVARFARLVRRRWPVAAVLAAVVALAVVVAVAASRGRERYADYRECKNAECGGKGRCAQCRAGNWKNWTNWQKKAATTGKGKKRGAAAATGGGGSFTCKVTEYPTDPASNDGWSTTSTGVDLFEALKNKTIATKGGKWMGRKMRIDYNGKTFVGTVGDICAPCSENHVDILVDNPDEMDEKGTCTLL
jgi:3D (Asp-Asp-Asp) domain-containing protein